MIYERININSSKYYFYDYLSLGKVFANCARTYSRISAGASEINGSSAGKCVHIYKILFKAFKAFYFKSSAEFGNLYTASKWEGTSKSAIDLA